MVLDLQLIIAFLALGCIVGFSAGLLGVGGGGIMVPILTSLFLAMDVPQDKVVHLALGTSMAAIIMTSIASLRAHNSRGAVLWQYFRLMSPGIIIGTFLATYVVALISSLALAIFFSVFMAVISLQMFIDKKPKLGEKQTSNKELFVVGSGIGAISALISIGGGSLTVPYLVSRHIEITKAIGTSAAIGLPIAISGTIGYLINGWANTNSDEYTFGFVYLPAVLLISLMSFMFAPLGAKLAHRLPIKILKKLFASLLILLSMKMLWSII